MIRNIALLAIIILFIGCQPQTPRVINLEGETMGTTYHVTFAAQPAVSEASTQQAIDSLLVAINASLSTYIPTSLISQINSSQDVPTEFALDAHFIAVFTASQQVYKATDGAFDPSVGPLVNAWGFGPTPKLKDPSTALDSLVLLVDFESLLFDAATETLTKTRAGTQLDFSAIAKGYAVDAVAALLFDMGIENYFVEIGGELVTHGLHPHGRPWRAGITRPVEGEKVTFQAVVSLENAAMATSGNYQNFYEEDGERFTHTINPQTGRPERSSLLSVSVLAPSCMLADGYATALMVKGWERAQAWVADQEDVEVYLIGADQDQFIEWATPDFPERVEPN